MPKAWIPLVLHPNSEQTDRSHHTASEPAINSNIGANAEQNMFVERFKTQLCRSIERKEVCQYGYNCMFAHSEEEKRTMDMNVKDGLFSFEAVEAYRNAQRRNLIALGIGSTLPDPDAFATSPISTLNTPGSPLLPGMISIRVGGAVLPAPPMSASMHHTDCSAMSSSTAATMASPLPKTMPSTGLFNKASGMHYMGGLRPSVEEIYDHGNTVSGPLKSDYGGDEDMGSSGHVDIRSTSPLDHSSSTVVQHFGCSFGASPRNGYMFRDHLRQTSSISGRTARTHERDISTSSAQSSVLPACYQLRSFATLNAVHPSPNPITFQHQIQPSLNNNNTLNGSGGPPNSFQSYGTGTTMGSYGTNVSSKCRQNPTASVGSGGQSNSGESTLSHPQQRTVPQATDLSPAANPNAKRKLTRKEKTLAKLAQDAEAAATGERTDNHQSPTIDDTSNKFDAEVEARRSFSNAATPANGSSHGISTASTTPDSTMSPQNAVVSSNSNPTTGVSPPKANQESIMRQFLGDFDATGAFYPRNQKLNSASENPQLANFKSDNIHSSHRKAYHSRQMSAPMSSLVPPPLVGREGSGIPMQRTLLAFTADQLPSHSISLCHSRQTTNESMDDSAVARMIGARVARGVGLDFSGSQTASPTPGADFAQRRHRHHQSNLSTTSIGSSSRYRHDPYGMSSPTQNPLASGSKQALSSDLLNAMYHK